MSSTDRLQHQSEEKVTFTVKSSTRSRFIAKLIITAGLVAVTTYFFTQNSAKQYEKGIALTQESYLKDFERYKQSLLRLEDYSNNLPFSSFVCFLVITSLVGSYELLAFIIGLTIGKIIKW
jgi:predicted PurR-regulated permease PerM